MTTPHATLYHVTPDFNTASILDHGVLPQHSRGARQVSWVCNDDGLLWSIAHISARYRVPVNCLTVFMLKPPVRITQTKWQGIFTCPHHIPVLVAKNATFYLGERS